MDQHHIALVEKFLPINEELKGLWEDHQLYKKQVEKLESKPFLSPTEEQTMKQLKKQKLENKTQLMAVLDRLDA
jgi:uncharacterized protein